MKLIVEEKKVKEDANAAQEVSVIIIRNSIKHFYQSRYNILMNQKHYLNNWVASLLEVTSTQNTLTGVEGLSFLKTRNYKRLQKIMDVIYYLLANRHIDLH